MKAKSREEKYQQLSLFDEQVDFPELPEAIEEKEEDKDFKINELESEIKHLENKTQEYLIKMSHLELENNRLRVALVEQKNHYRKVISNFASDIYDKEYREDINI